jgi:hypothetical protein
MNEERDQDVVRLLREYQEELRSASPPPSVLAKIQAEARRAQPAVVTPIRSRWRPPGVWSGLAVAASLLVAIGIYRTRVEPAAPVQMAKVEAPPPVAVAAPRVELDEQAETANRANAPAPAPPKPVVDPNAPPSIRAALEAATPGPAEAERRHLEAIAAPAASADAKPAEPVVRAESQAPADKKTVAAPVLHATVVRQVWEPGQVARVFTGTYQRLADGTEAHSPLAPADVLAMAQNSMAVAPSQVPSQSQAPGAPAQAPATLGRSRELRAPAPVRDQIAEAKKKLASPQSISLGTGIIEGYRCAGTRVVDGHRSVERWYSPELGLVLMERTTEASGAEVVVRYVNIEKR